MSMFYQKKKAMDSEDSDGISYIEKLKYEIQCLKKLNEDNNDQIKKLKENVVKLEENVVELKVMIADITISTYEHRTNQNNVSTEPPNVTHSYAEATQASIPRKKLGIKFANRSYPCPQDDSVHQP